MQSNQPSQGEIIERDDGSSLYKIIYIAKRWTDGTKGDLGGCVSLWG